MPRTAKTSRPHVCRTVSPHRGEGMPLAEMPLTHLPLSALPEGKGGIIQPIQSPKPRMTLPGVCPVNAWFSITTTPLTTTCGIPVG